MELGAIKESLGKLNTGQLSQLRNHLLSQDVASLGMSADQAMGLLQAIEELDTRDVQPNFPPSQSVPSFPVPQQTDLDMPQVMGNINRLFLSAFGSPRGVENSVVYQPVSELTAINERVQMLEMQRARILSAQKMEQQNIQSAVGDGSAWTGPNPKRRMVSNDETNFNEVQGFQGNWMQGGNQTRQMNQSTVQINQPRAQMNQSTVQMNQPRALMSQLGGGQSNQSRGRAKMTRGGFANTKKQSRGRSRKGKQKLKNEERGGQQWSSPGRSDSRGDSYGRRSPDNKDYYERRSGSRESVGRDRRDNSNDRGHSYNRRSHDRDQRDDQGYGRGGREGSRNRDTDSHEKRYREQDDGYSHRSNDDDNRSFQGERSYQDDSRSYQDEGRSYQDESKPYPESPRGDGYFRSESNDLLQDDQFDDRGDRQVRKRKHRYFDEGSWHSDDRHDQEPPRRYSPERDYPDHRFSDGEFVDRPRGGGSHFQDLPFDFLTKTRRSQERDERRWDDRPQKDVLDTPVGIEERWHDRKFNRSGDRELGPANDKFFLRQGEVFNPDLTRARYGEDELMINPPERRSLDLNLGRIKPIPLSVGLGVNRHLRIQPLAHRLGAQLPPRDSFQRGFSGPAIPSKEAPVSARMQGFVMRNQTNIKTKVNNFSELKPFHQTRGDFILANLLLRSGIPDMLPIKKPDLQNTKVADKKEAAGSVPQAGTPTTDQSKGKSKDLLAGKTLTNKPRPIPLKPEANSIGNQCDILETLELQGFLYHRVLSLWTCYICRTALKNGGAYKIHLISRNHVNTYNKLLTYQGVFDRQKIAFALRNLPNHRTVSPEQLSSAGSVNRMYFCCECGEGYSCTALDHRKTERHVTLESYRKCCYLCNLYCSDYKALVKHQNSKLHITMKVIKRKEEVQVPGNVQNKTPIISRTFVPSKVPLSGQKPVSSKPSNSSKTLFPNKAPISGRASVPTKGPVLGQKPVSSKQFISSKTPASRKASFPTKKPIFSRATTSNKSSTPTKELSSDVTDGTALKSISGLQSERKSIKVTLKGTKTPATGKDSGQSYKDGKVGEENEEIIGLDLVIPVTGFFCRCCSKFYNNKYMAERNHCMTAEHKQKALAWFKSHGTANPQKKPAVSNKREAKSTPQKPVCPPTKPNQSETIIVIDDDEDSDEVKGTSEEKQQSPRGQDEMDTGEPKVTTQARPADKTNVNAKVTDYELTPGAVISKEDNGQVPDHAEKSNESLKIVDVKEQHQLTDRPVGRKLRAIRAQHKSTKESDLEDGEIISEGELSVNEQSEASVEKMEVETAEQLKDKTENPPTITVESGDEGQTREGTVDSTSAEMEVKTTDPTVQESVELSSEVMVEDQAIEETEEPLTSSDTDQNVKENVELHISEAAKPATDLSVEVTDTATSELDNMDQSVDILEEPPITEMENILEEPPITEMENILEEPTITEMENILEEPPITEMENILEEPPNREMEKASDGPNSDMTTEPPNMELDTGTTDLTVSSNAEPTSGETEIAQAGGNLPSGGLYDLKEIEQSKEDAAETLVTADKDIDLTEDDLYADLVEHAPEEEMEESLESREEQGNEQEDEIDEEEDDEDTRFFIDEGNWEVRSEEDGSNGEPINDDGVLDGDEDDELIVIEDEEDNSEDVEENDNDAAS